LVTINREGTVMRMVLGAIATLVASLLVVPAWSQDAAVVADVLKVLRGGGHVIVVRHGATHSDQADTDPLNLDNVTKQRQLNDKGRADAKAVGEALKAAGVPIGKCYSSRFYRAVETARLIAGKDPEATADVSEGGQVVTPDENNRRAQALRRLIGTVPDAGTNTLIVTHKPNILDALGRDWFEIKEGEASIFKPDGTGKYSLVGRVQVERWVTAR
jgi:phosphohistidine phosphatase SixA